MGIIKSNFTTRLRNLLLAVSTSVYSLENLVIIQNKKESAKKIKNERDFPLSNEKSCKELRKGNRCSIDLYYSF
ncbi:MAG: hypothetical protein C7M88_03945 [Candidatus Arcticimaribacter sp.]|nr:MAG: hypothetical protein C7M88_03945 [Candidatus Arcticimaribacter sp.]